MLAAACSACGDDGGGAIDATPTVDIDNGSCGDQLRFTGELIDWDSGASFCGIFNAALEGGGAMDNSNPNGRFDMCIPKTAVTQVTVTPAATNSQCTTPPSSYPLGGIAVANPAVIQAGGFWSGRAFTTDRQTSLFTDVGVPFDATKAQVVVHVEGAARAVAILATHATAQAHNGTTWAAGETGKDVFFPNVDVAGGSTMLTAVGGAIGTGTIPLAAGKITFVSVLAN